MMESAAYDLIKQEGRMEGRMEGLTEGRKELLFKMIEVNFGSVTDFVKDKIGSESPEKIDLFAQSLFGFQSLDDAENWWKERR